jgi:hypothetical protein
VTTLVTVNNTSPTSNVVAFPSGYSLQPACTAANGGGDLTTDLGEYSCHERALRVKVGTITRPDLSSAQGFWVLVKGNKQPLLTSISQKRGLLCPIKSTAIVGLGLDIPEGCVSSCGNFNAHQAVSNIKIVVWEGCQITKYFSPTTGAFQGVTAAPLDIPNPPNCDVAVGEYNTANAPKPVTGLLLQDTSTTGSPQEPVTFADGDATSGNGSCFNTFVGGVYSRVCH